MSSSLSPRDATCLSIGQHSLYEVTWEPSHPALRPLWGSFERGKKERPKSSLDGGWTNRYKATLELNVLSLCVWTRARQSRQRVGSQEGWGQGERVFLCLLATLFFALAGKATTLRPQRTKYILNQ